MLRAVIGTGMEVAGGAGGAAIRTKLHIPEEGFAEECERGTVGDVLVDVGGLRNGDGS